MFIHFEKINELSMYVLNYVYAYKLSCVLPANVVVDKFGNNMPCSNNNDRWRLAHNCNTKMIILFIRKKTFNYYSGMNIYIPIVFS